MIDQVSGTAEKQPADESLHSTLATALAESRNKPAETPITSTRAEPTEAPVEEPAEPAEVTEPKESVAEKKGHTLGDRKEPEAEEAKQPEGTPDEKRAEALAKATAKWSEADKAILAKSPPEVQDLMVRRVRDMDADYTRKTQAIAALKTEYEPIEQMFAPHKERLQAAGFTPRSIIQAWANVEDKLTRGEGLAVVDGLIKAYNLDITPLAAARGLVRPGTADAPAAAGASLPQTGAAANIPPEFEQRLRGIEGQIQTRAEQEAAAQRAQAQRAVQAKHSEIEEFKGAADAKGNPLHPHFEALEQDMLVLANSIIQQTGKPPSLQELYDRAVFANPSTREQVLTAQRQSEEARRNEEARAKAARAKGASGSVTGGPGISGSVKPDMSKLSLRDQLVAAKRSMEDSD